MIKPPGDVGSVNTEQKQCGWPPTAPKMMSVGLHMRLIGHPARAVGLERLLDPIIEHDGVWVARRLDIARHWMATHPYQGKGLNE